MPAKRGTTAVWIADNVLAVLDLMIEAAAKHAPRPKRRAEFIEDLIWAYSKGDLIPQKPKVVDELMDLFVADRLKKFKEPPEKK